MWVSVGTWLVESRFIQRVHVSIDDIDLFAIVFGEKQENQVQHSSIRPSNCCTLDPDYECGKNDPSSTFTFRKRHFWTWRRENAALSSTGAEKGGSNLLWRGRFME